LPLLLAEMLSLLLAEVLSLLLGLYASAADAVTATAVANFLFATQASLLSFYRSCLRALTGRLLLCIWRIGARDVDALIAFAHFKNQSVPGASSDTLLV
jgi:hypothetical protein